MDKNTNFAFMKSGFDLTDDGDNIDADFAETVTAMITLFGENALRTSALYTTHAKRRVVTVEDLQRAMKLEVFLYTLRPDTLEKCTQIKEQLFPKDDVEEEEENESEETEEEFQEYENAEFKESECSCSLCQGLNTINEKWNNWEPNSPMETILKKHIDAMD